MTDAPDDVEAERGFLSRFRNLINKRQIERERPRRIHVIVNPAAGRDQPILKTLNAAMKTAAVDWELLVTKEAGDALLYAEQAAKTQVDVVIAYGGDGTVMEVATGLMSSQTAMAIIPGGTGNVMAMELGIPFDLAEAIALAINPEALIRAVDMGRIGEMYFLLRAGMGFEAAMVEGADRELKDRYGVLAYALAGLQALANPPIARYRMLVDGLEIESQGVTCIIANSGTILAPGVRLTPTINVSDGLLDVIVLRKADLGSLISVTASLVGGTENRQALLHWQGREITVDADPPQTIQVDGELMGETPVTARVIPEAVKIIVPQAGVVPETDETEAGSEELGGG